MAANVEETMSESLSVERDLSSFDKHDESEGRRMQVFKKVMKKCLDKVLASGSQEKFGSCFAALKAQNPAAFKSITEQLMQLLRTNIEKEIDLMIKQEDLVYFFNELDQIIAASGDGDSSEPAWRPSGDPHKDTCDHVVQVKLAYKEQLMYILQKVDSESKRLQEEVLPKRDRLLESEKRLSVKMKDLKEAAEYTEEIDLNYFKEQSVPLGLR